jgi:hypothetical protein
VRKRATIRLVVQRRALLAVLVTVLVACAHDRPARTTSLPGGQTSGTSTPAPAPSPTSWADSVVKFTPESGPVEHLSDIPDSTRTPWASPPIGQGVAGHVLGIPQCTIQPVDPCGLPDDYLEGQQVVLLDQDGRTAGRATTDSEGQYAIAAPVGTFTAHVNVRAPWYGLVRCEDQQVDVVPDVTVALSPQCVELA